MLVKLRGLDLSAGVTVAACLSTAAALHGFDTENPEDLHILNPEGHQLRAVPGLMVHRRRGAPLTLLGDCPLTGAAWTAIEVARCLKRPRALATLDAALRSRTCDRHALQRAAKRQAGRRGIVAVRELIELADGLAGSPMESEARLAMLDGGLPRPSCNTKSSMPTADYGGSTSPGRTRRWPRSTKARNGTTAQKRCATTERATQHFSTSDGRSCRSSKRMCANSLPRCAVGSRCS